VTALTIISGAQTGADRAGLDFAIAKKIPHKGWCPKGRKAEDGVIPPQYQLQETPSSGYLQRTEWNTRDSDATLIFTMGASLSGGSKRTAEFARKHKKPFLHIFLGSEAPTPAHIVAFIRENHVTLLNVAGTRGSKEPRVHGFTFEMLQKVFDLLED
jgi:hypothetical protein